MVSPFLAASIATVVAAGLVPLARALALRVGAVDIPEPGRHIHTLVTARLGGVAIFAAYVTALGVGLGWSGFPEDSRLIGAVLAGSTVVILVGVMDDIRGLGARKKLAAQFVAANIAWMGGAQIAEQFYFPSFGLVSIGPVASYLSTIVWILAFTNAINLIDGLDGLAGGVVFFASVTNVIVAIIAGDVLGATVNAALAGAVLGFLFFNFNPATIFMGDSGSMFLGYALGTTALFSARGKASTLVSLLVPLIALGLPVADTLFSMVRRVIARQPVFAADNGHIHHRLLALGLNQRRAVLILYACSILLCVAALALAVGTDWQVGLALGGAVATLLGIARFAGMFEVALRQRRLPVELYAGALCPMRRSLPILIARLDRAGEREEALCVVEEMSVQMGLSHVTLYADQRLESVWRWEKSNKGTRNDGELHEAVFSLSAGAGEASGKVVFGCYLDECNSAREFELLMQLASDAIAAALLRQARSEPRPASEWSAAGSPREVRSSGRADVSVTRAG